MFRLHDNTRRRICRAVFLLLCVVPTAGVSAWCARRHLPGVAAAEAKRLERELGLDVSLAGLRYLRPGRVLYEGLELRDPETGRPLLRCRALEADWQRSTDREGRPRASLVLIASQPEIEATAADPEMGARQVGAPLGELLDRMLRCPTILRMVPGGSQTDVRLAAGQLTLRAAGGSQTFSGLQGSIESFAGGTQAEASFRLAGIDTPQPIRIRIVRNRQITPPATGFELDTGGGAVPCGLLAIGLPLLERLGPRSRLRGYIWANQTGDGRRAPTGHRSAGVVAEAKLWSRWSADWEGEFAGQVSDVDLDELVTGHFPHKLGGTAQVTIQSARFRRQRLEEATGTLVAGPGVISRSLIDAAVEQLGLVRGVEPQTPGELVPYEQLAAGFLIDARGLQLQGGCSPSGHRSEGLVAGAILADRQGRLLGEPVVQPQPVVALVRTLVPASQHQVPATRQTDWLIGHLPVPQVVPPAGARPAVPQARLRLHHEGPQ